MIDLPTTWAGPPAASNGIDKAYALSDPKHWATCRARAALRGVCIVRSDPADGPVRIFFEHAGHLGEVRSLDDLEGLL